MAIRVTASQYEKQVYIDGVADGEPELVGGEFLKGWLKSAEWFDNLVAEAGQPAETHKKLSGGVIVVEQFNPEGVKYTTIFTPVRWISDDGCTCHIGSSNCVKHTPMY